MARYSIVIPCYRSSKTIEKVVALTAEELERLGLSDYEFVLVNDCSPDGGETIAALYRLADAHDYVKVVNLGKNAGQHNATMAGLNYASGDFIISMDDDMQTRPSEIIKLKTRMDEGFDIVFGYYEKKRESLFRRMGSALNSWTVRMLIHKPKWLKTSSFWMIRRYVRDYLIRDTHPDVHLQSLFLRTSSNIACVPIEHFAREVGTSTYTLKKLIKLYTNIVGFSSAPLNFLMVLGCIFAAGGLAADLVALIVNLIRPEFHAVWTALFGTGFFLTGVLLAAMGLVGSYVSRIQMGQTQAPQFVVRDLRNLEEKE